MPSWHWRRMSLAPVPAARARPTSVFPPPASPSSSSGCSSTTARWTAIASWRSARYPWAARASLAAPTDSSASVTLSSMLVRRRDSPRGSKRVFDRPAGQHPRQGALVLARGVGVRRRPGAVRGALGGLGDVLVRELLAPERILRGRRPERDRAHV